jgi:prophage maintenance system killer protein
VQPSFAEGAADIGNTIVTVDVSPLERDPFASGNKRLALVAMHTFLEINGYRIEATDPELADWIIELGRGGTPEQLADHIRPRLRPTHDA